MTEKRVTAEDWNQVFQSAENPAPRKAPDAETVRRMGIMAVAMIDSAYAKYNELKYAEHIPINGRVPKILTLVDALRTIHSRLDGAISNILKDFEKSSSTLLRCELLHMARNLFLVDELIFENKKTKEAHKDFYLLVARRTSCQDVNTMRSMLRVATLSEPVRKQLLGTPLAENLSFLRTLNTKAGDDWNISRISERLTKLNKSIDRGEPLASPIAPVIPLLPNKCDECGDQFDRTQGGFVGIAVSMCRACLDKSARSIVVDD